MVSSKMKRPWLNRSFVFHTLSGAIGFGFGGLLGASVFPRESTLFPLPALGIMGTVGGATLGVSLSNWRRALLLAFAIAAVFSLWSVLGAEIDNFLKNLTKTPAQSTAILFGVTYLLFWGTLVGIFTGASLGFFLRNRGMTKYLAFAGGIGFGIGAEAAWCMLTELAASIVFLVWGMVGGSILAGTLSYQSAKRGLSTERPKC